MKRRKFCLFPLLLPALARSAEPFRFQSDKLKAIDDAIGKAITEKRIPGAVLWLERNGVSYSKAYGSRQVDPTVKPMRMDTIFDVASLTKVIATTPAILKLVEMGKLKLEDPVSKFIPAFTGDDREKITIRQLLTHTSGLRPGINKEPPWSGYAAGIARACVEPIRQAAGTGFIYSDINFILLGEIVRKASGQRLDFFLRKHVFDPVGMYQTLFQPSSRIRERIAPTTREGTALVHGVVHDPTSRRMGGVTGHAGLFSKAEDVARYARMILAGGISASKKRILSQETIRAMSTVQTDALPDKRGLGWDIRTRYSEPRGTIFPDLKSFGHTGWTGTSIWIDPTSNTFLILLANRNHPTESGAVKTLRIEVANLAAEAAGLTARPATPPAEAEKGAKGAKGPGPVKQGIDALQARKFEDLAGLRLGLITNHTGCNADGERTVDLLHRAKGINLVSLFSPEHGLSGKAAAGEKVGNETDEATKLPIFSLYGESRRPKPAQLANLDALVFDMQDIGCRFYTYISTMLEGMRAAAEAGKEFIVLDRVNPLGGERVDGPMLGEKPSFIACHNLPLQHGMTVGELAELFRRELKLNLKLRVIAVEGWNRQQWLDETGLTWRNPSPNMRSLDAATLYPGTGLLEPTNVSVGRGTEAPFQILGAPWIKSAPLATRLTELNLPGVKISAHDFVPTTSVHEGKSCGGIRITVTDRKKVPSVRLGLEMIAALWELHPTDFQIDKANGLLRHSPTLAVLKRRESIPGILKSWESEVTAFRKRRQGVLMYQ